MIFPETIGATTLKIVVNNNSGRNIPYLEICDWCIGDTQLHLDFKNVMLETVTISICISIIIEIHISC